MRVPLLRHLGSAPAILLALAACGSQGGGSTGPAGCATGGTGNLDVTVSMPAGVTADVRVTGPAGFARTVTATQTFTAIPAGQYELRIRRTVQPAAAGALTGTAWGASARTVRHACVPLASTATIPVGYVRQPASGKAWVSNAGRQTVAAFPTTSLASGGTAAADVVLDFDAATDDSATGPGLAFDDMGNLWMADPVGQGTPGRVLAFAPGDLGSSGTPDPVIVLTGTALDRPAALAFDASGNLWIAAAGGDAIVMFSADQVAGLLVAPGSTPRTRTPSVVLQGPDIVAPRALAFDGTGNLWIIGDDPQGLPGDRAIVELASADLGASATAVGSRLVIAGDTGSIALTGLSGLAFDNAGDLTVVGGGLRKYDAAQQALSGRQEGLAPAQRLDTTGHASQSDHAAFDAQGNLWITAQPTGLDRLTSGGALSPNLFASTDLSFPESLAFYPSPPGLPIP